MSHRIVQVGDCAIFADANVVGAFGKAALSAAEGSDGLGSFAALAFALEDNTINIWQPCLVLRLFSNFEYFVSCFINTCVLQREWKLIAPWSWIDSCLMNQLFSNKSSHQKVKMSQITVLARWSRHSTNPVEYWKTRHSLPFLARNLSRRTAWMAMLFWSCLCTGNDPFCPWGTSPWLPSKTAVSHRPQRLERLCRSRFLQF